MSTKKTPIIQYFINGIKLINNSLDLLLIRYALMAVFISLIIFHFTGVQLFFAEILNLVSVALALGLSLSIPLFLIKRRAGKKINYSEFLSTIKNTTWNILGITLLVLILMVIFLLGIITFLFIAAHPATKAESALLVKTFAASGMRILLLLVAVISSYFRFAPSIYCFKKPEFISSFKQSFSISTKELRFVVPIIVLTIISSQLTLSLPSEPVWVRLLKLLVSSYVGLIMSATAFLYYVDLKAKTR